ncbi:glutamate dehydrogenase, partial [candidate division WOR-3 bacterium]|nr:glutamate dehydrogenase [candidate division WOR-3 bacterium]
LKNVKRGRIEEYAEKYKGVVYTPVDPKAGRNPLWNYKAHCAFPSATQNEVNGKDAANLLKNGVFVVSEGANMPSTPDAMKAYVDARVLYGPSKAANSGGVAVSGLEMSQNRLGLLWTCEDVDGRLRDIMKSVHQQCVRFGRADDGYVNYLDGANVAGFVRVADAMLAQGVV